MLKPEHFSYKCPLKISDLEETENGHFCAKCSKDIHDLTDCSLDEIRELQRRKGSICGFVRAISVTSVVSLAACSDEENAGNKGNANPGEAQPAPVEQPELMGDICIPEELAPKPKPENAHGKDDSTAATGGKETDKAPDPEISEIKGPPIKEEVLLGKICPQNELIPEKPEAPKPLDPDREGSPG